MSENNHNKRKFMEFEGKSHINLNLFSGKQIKFKVFITINSIIKYKDSIEEDEDLRKAFFTFLKSLIFEPERENISSVLESLSDDEIIEIGEKLIQCYPDLGKYYDKSSNPNFYNRFKLAIELYNNEWRKKLTNVALSTKMQVNFTLLHNISGSMKRITEQIQDIGRRYNENYPIMLEKSAELAKQGWLLSPTMTPGEIVDLLDKSDIDDYYLKYYADKEEYRKLKNAILNHKLFWKHRSLIKECLFCYENEKYKIIIPAAISVLEGVLAEISKSNKYGWKLVKEVEFLVDNSEEYSIRLMVLNSILVFVKEVFQTHSFDNERLEMINRNWILHGRDASGLWAKSDALKLLNALYSFTLL